MGITMNWQHANRWCAGWALCLEACLSVVASVLAVIAMALRPATAKPQRVTALLLLGSLACVAVALAGRLPSEVRLAFGMFGAIGLLISGVAGACLDAKASITSTTPDDSWNRP